MHAAMQQSRGTIDPGPGQLRPFPPAGTGRTAALSMSLHTPRQLFIQGTTLQGRAFRPSDWAERLAGAMSSFRPAGSAGGIAAYIGYSPYCVPQLLDGVKSVLVSEALRDVEPMAWDFVMNFARDNALKVVDAKDGSAVDPSAV